MVLKQTLRIDGDQIIFTNFEGEVYVLCSHDALIPAKMDEKRLKEFAQHLDKILDGIVEYMGKILAEKYKTDGPQEEN